MLQTMAAAQVAETGRSTLRPPAQPTAAPLQPSSIAIRRQRSHASAPIASTEPSAAPALPPPAAATAASTAFQQLAAAALDTCTVQLQPCAAGHGLYLNTSAAAGDVLLCVPLDRCLVVDYSGSGLRLPQAQWPRLRKGVQKDDALPWDILQASKCPSTCMHQMDGACCSCDCACRSLCLPAALAAVLCCIAMCAPAV